MIGGKATPANRGDHMSYSVRRLAAGIVFPAGIASMSGASAAPVSDALAIKNAVPAQVETVQWRWWGPGLGFFAGAAVGTALAAPYYNGYGPYYGYGYGYGPRPYYAAPYYPAPYYAAPGYPAAPPPGYAVAPPPGYAAAGPPPGGGGVASCAQRFKSYDPRTGTYLGTDGARHPCR
jgi:BA14K-like protein